MHHKTVVLQEHFLPHKVAKQREALLSHTASAAAAATAAGSLKSRQVSKDVLLQLTRTRQPLEIIIRKMSGYITRQANEQF